MPAFPSNPVVLSGIIFCGSLVVAYTTTGWYLRWALRHQVLDQPNERSSHHIPTPRGGGVGIVFAMLLNLGFWVWDGHVLNQTLAALGLGTVALATISWIDDLIGLPALTRLAVQTGTAAVVVFAWGTASDSTLPMTATGAVLAFFLIAWIVTHLNFYNFMDGIDGIAATQAAFVGLAWMIAGWWRDSHILTFLGCGLSASCLAFLCFNWPPARIFMGDVGSASLGFLAGTMPLLANDMALVDSLVFAGLVSGPFLMDATLTLILRASRRENLLNAHRTHQYQRLVASGLSHQSVTFLYSAWAVVCAACGLCWLANVPMKNILVISALIVPEAVLAILTIIRCERMKNART